MFSCAFHALDEHSIDGLSHEYNNNKIATYRIEIHLVSLYRVILVHLVVPAPCHLQYQSYNPALSTLFQIISSLLAFISLQAINYPFSTLQLLQCLIVLDLFPVRFHIFDFYSYSFVVNGFVPQNDMCDLSVGLNFSLARKFYYNYHYVAKMEYFVGFVLGKAKLNEVQFYFI